MIGCAAGSTVLPAPAQADTAKAGEAFADLDADGAWTFFIDPRALYYQGAQEKFTSGSKKKNVRPFPPWRVQGLHPSR